MVMDYLFLNEKGMTQIHVARKTGLRLYSILQTDLYQDNVPRANNKFKTLLDTQLLFLAETLLVPTRK